MLLRHVGYEAAIFTVLCAVVIFLFPTVNAAYSVLHSPITALLNLRAKLAFRLEIGLPELAQRAGHFHRRLKGPGFVGKDVFSGFSLAAQPSVFRC